MKASKRPWVRGGQRWANVHTPPPLALSSPLFISLSFFLSFFHTHSLSLYLYLYLYLYLNIIFLYFFLPYFQLLLERFSIFFLFIFSSFLPTYILHFCCSFFFFCSYSYLIFPYFFSRCSNSPFYFIFPLFFPLFSPFAIFSSPLQVSKFAADFPSDNYFSKPPFST